MSMIYDGGRGGGVVHRVSSERGIGAKRVAHMNVEQVVGTSGVYYMLIY